MNPGRDKTLFDNQPFIMHPEEILQKNLKKSILFREVAKEEIDRIIDTGHWRRVKQGEYVYRQAENDHNFYIVAAGEVELILNVEDDSRLIVGHIGPGGHFGETSLLTNSCNSLNVRAMNDLYLLCFDADTFTSVLLNNHAVQRQLSIALADRLRISFHDHAQALAKTKNFRNDGDDQLDSSFFSETKTLGDGERLFLDSERGSRLSESTIARQIRKAVKQFSDNLAPVLLTGENGTGRRMLAYEIHRAGASKDGPYTEVDIRAIDPADLEVELFGYERDSSAFSQVDQLGVFERLQGGTVVLNNAEYMEPDFQRQLAGIIGKKAFTKVGGTTGVGLNVRIIMICQDRPRIEDGHNRLLPALYALFADQHFRVAPLRGHRRDIPRLVQYYLKRYSLQYAKSIHQVDEQTMGMFMNYDWPGNLIEMASVLQRAVILGKSNVPLNHQNLLGVPKSEGKWEFNLLRLAPIRAFLTSPLFPGLPRAIVGAFFILVLAILFFGPVTGEKNIGLTLSWVVGWPLLIFAFFFFARTWCSVCGLSVPGWLAQKVIKPERPTPQIIRQYSGWIMTFLCIILFWIETAWNAYGSPRLTAWIILTITMSSLLFSILYKRRVWCRYICPLGAINALFSMPSILELRANRQSCMNRCIDQLCYNGDELAAGCPMFRHPFLVDNNRDCILCGQCIKNCKLNSIHLNLRLAPQELWNLQSPRLEDSVLVVSLAAIFYPFALNQKYAGFAAGWTDILHGVGMPYNEVMASSIFFFACIAIYLSGYAVMSKIMSQLTGSSWKTTASILGYSMIPMVLGAFMTAHLEIFVGGIWLLPANLRDLVGLGSAYNPSRLISTDATFILQLITIVGSLIASLYATQRIVKRLLVDRPYEPKMFLLPAFLLCLSAIAYLMFA